MIDTEIIYNLIAQDLVKKHNITRDNEVLFLMVTNGGRLHLYKQYQVAIEIHEHDSS